ncbi:ribonuclease III [Clostridium algidicarnis]|uniref:Ribonuclease 3 n=2 Tax=Clostridium algidicarnis TaxID=37659 RepID=A0A2S6G190_9CLOT|nr:ribonuclease III [Clostridium algidicarnis]MBB6631189.1 ribonuclease III [Clostridium algidicarnis]MBB6696159.1 ribonuclease III [Clostridium algidicarnis]MBU3193899.1 ribonuclease III [Clostridium algidicarnis]MBU3203221.1 ribonuclease III [Clostridium algidicarnis]MBU3205485.1 ribonuclease III [Clostridium algidicarnis]
MKHYLENIKNIEKQIDTVFSDKEHLLTAITHSSYANQFKNVDYNERLEFLGDSVLQLCITEYLFNNYKQKSEGDLTKLRSLIVCENSLYEIALTWGIGRHMRMSRGEELTGGRDRVSIQADCVEAVIAAVYLDKGIDYVTDFILKSFKETISKAINQEIVLDYKTALQEKLQKDGEVEIDYELVKYEGPPHRRKFYTKVVINNKVMGEGNGYSKKESEQSSAKEALLKLEEIHE